MSWGILKQQRGKPTAATRKTASKLDSSYIATAAAKGCAGCPLDKANLESPKIKPSGSDSPTVYILGEAPGREEDEQGVQFVGPSGKLLRRLLPRDAEDKLRWNNVIRCRPPANRDPSLLEIACCRKQQEEDIARSKPSLILGFGHVPLAWMGLEGKISTWRGRMIPVNVGGHSCWYMPLLHPSYILRTRHQRNGEEIESLFRRDLADAFSRINNVLEEPFIDRAKDKDEGVFLLPCKLSAVRAALEKAKAWKEYGFDLETSDLRPYAKGAKILSFAISSYDCTYAVPLRHRQATWSDNDAHEVDKMLVDLLRSGGKVIAHNTKFEQEWMAYFFGPSVIHDVQWEDTMAQSYVLDEREGAKSLEAVSQSSIGMNVKALRTRSGRHVNVKKLDEEQLADVLDYNAYDAKYVVPVFLVQQERLRQEDLLEVYRMQTDRSGAIALAQVVGMQPDSKVALEINRELAEKQRATERAIQQDADVKLFAKKNGRFLPTSNKDLPAFFHGQLKYKECEVGEKDGKVRLSTDEDVLTQIEHPVAQLILDLRKTSKLQGTYVEPLLEGGKHIWPDGLVHTMFNHLRTSTGRLSSEDPNLQNQPIRSVEGRRIRKIFVAPKGYYLAAFDYGQIEARVIAMASKCPVLTKALWEGWDIHGEWAKRLATEYPKRVGGKELLQDKAVMKEFRNDVKNQWTFPLFFGSVLDNVAENLSMPKKVVEPLYEEFWDAFAAVKDWQEALRKSYRKLGYVATLTGRRRHGPMTLNEIANSPIQGTASDIVVESMRQLSILAYKLNRPQLQPRLNVHDDLTFIVPERTLEEDVETIAQAMVMPRYSFINVPLVLEVKVGRNWCDVEEVANLSSTDYGHRRAA